MKTFSEKVTSDFINDAEISTALSAFKTADASAIKNILAKAKELHGLSPQEVAALMAVSDPELLGELFSTAKWIKERIYGKRLVLFAPLYISNMCSNECVYCAFRARNKAVQRRALTQEEIVREVRILVEQGHKRILLVAGEGYPQEGFDYILKAVKSIYSVKSGKGEIRRVNVNIAPLSVEDFIKLKAEGIGTYQVFQETYSRKVYANVHTGGMKKNYDWRVTAMDRAMQARIDDVGIGVLFGLGDWRYEILAILMHIRHLEQKFGVGPHTISVPRLEPAVGSDFASSPPYPISDVDFRKIVAILRVAVPYTGIIMSTRETPNIRRETFALGVSQISAGSRTNPGGYSSSDGEAEASQFSLGDHRPLDEVIRDVASLGYIPSFCTACYRLGRTGQDFMDLAKPGEIKAHCDPNGLSTFQEYLLDYASPETVVVGEKLIASTLEKMDAGQKNASTQMLEKVRAGQRDVYI